MLSGMNTDIDFKGETYHIQTEDGGVENPVITTLLFKGGAIFSSKKSNYAEILQSPTYREAVKELMKEQHKSMVRDLAQGKIQSLSPSGPKEIKKDQPHQEIPPPSPPLSGSPSSTPSPSQKIGPKKSLDDLILDYLSEKEEGGR
ncbi:MAG: hypothetical protein WBK96_06860 [Candidatus Manganitrophaceae bacterium]